MKKIAIIDDDRVLGELIGNKVRELKRYSEPLIYTNPTSYIQSADKADIVLLDIVMQPIGGLEAIPLILARDPECSIVINSIKDDPDTIFQALQLGAVGYVDKQSFESNYQEVFNNIEQGGAYMTARIARRVIQHFQKPQNNLESLTARENDVVSGILDGMSYKMVADKYQISLDTVRMNIKSIYKKLKINSKGELFRLMSSRK